MNKSRRWKRSIYKYFRSQINRYYNIYAYCAVLKKVIKELKQSYYNILIEISNHKIRTLWNIKRNDTRKIQRAEKISEVNVGPGHTENAKEMVCAFNKLFLLTLILNINTDSRLAMGLASEISVEQVAREFES